MIILDFFSSFRHLHNCLINLSVLMRHWHLYLILYHCINQNESHYFYGMYIPQSGFLPFILFRGGSIQVQADIWSLYLSELRLYCVSKWFLKLVVIFYGLAAKERDHIGDFKNLAISSPTDSYFTFFSRDIT